MVFWNENKIIKKLREIILDYNYFPTAKELRTNNNNDLISAIYRSGKNMSYFRKKLGHPIKKKESGYWRNWSNVEKEIRNKFGGMIESGICPSCNAMKRSGIDSCVFQKKLFGGIFGIARKLKCKVSNVYLARDGHFLLSNYELIFDEYLYSLGIEHKPNGLLSKDKRYKYDQKVGDLYFEILGYSKNDNTKRSKNYIKGWKKKKKYYDLKKIKLIIIEKDFFEVSYKEIESNLDNMFHDLGFSTKRKIPFNVRNIVENGRVDNDVSILSSLSKIIKNINKFPSANDLIKLKRFDLIHKIRTNGGFKKFRKKMGYKDYRRPNGFYTLEKTLEEIKKIIRKKGRYPKYKDCSSSLSHGIAKNGGFIKLKQFIEKSKNDRSN